MPEGHLVHRHARELGERFEGRPVEAPSPQGRFTDAAATIDGSSLTGAEAYGKHLFLQFDADGPTLLHVHLGRQGRWLWPAAGAAPPASVRLRLASADAAADLIADVAAGRARLERLTMVEARLDDGQVVTALNEVFVGHASHQSARYTLHVNGSQERQSSSGIIVATGTGATGWAASINRAIGLALPEPCDGRLAYFVREAWPSLATGTSLTAGIVDRLTIVCELGEGGVVFGDGIEADRVAVDWGQRIEIGPSGRTLRLVD
jgi:hypothetical protein